ncbi:sigma-70 family RNA polymerase sigma factor [Sphingomonas koreensis]|nr:sigma-70 family RNA polymerase sigma factor [Sphingomonas koreensis]
MTDIDPVRRERASRAFRRTIAAHNNSAPPDPAMMARLEDAARRMPRFQREIFLAVRLDDYSYAEIAERTGITPKQVERLFAQALGNFCRNLADPRRCRWRRWFR